MRHTFKIAAIVFLVLFNIIKTSFGQETTSDTIVFVNLLRTNTGSHSTEYGTNALENNTADYASGFGYGALYNNAADQGTSGFGYKALYSNQEGNCSGFGCVALGANKEDCVNGFGVGALKNNTGSMSNAFGFCALLRNTGGGACAFGHYSLWRNNGANNVGLGRYTMEYTSSTGSGNTAIGYMAGTVSHMGTTPFSYSNTTMLGANSMATKNNQVVLGDNNVVEVKTSGVIVHANGVNDNESATVGQVKTFIDSLGGSEINLQTVANNGNYTTKALAIDSVEKKADYAKHRIFIINNSYPLFRYQIYYWENKWVATKGYGFGEGSLMYNKGAYSNSFGHNALNTNEGRNSNGFGYAALKENTGNNSNGFGNGALRKNTGSNSNGFGYFALKENTGKSANGFGQAALRGNTGNNCNGFGNFALQYNTGNKNSGFGHQTLYKTATSAAKNTAIGYKAGWTSAEFTYSNTTMLGANSLATKDNQVVLGDTTVVEVKTSGVIIHADGVNDNESATVGQVKTLIDSLVENNGSSSSGGSSLWTKNNGSISYAEGNVAIGDTATSQNLHVYGTTYANEVIVKTDIPTPDYVFKEDYNLKSLEEVEQYIKTNGHLPEIPSATEVDANGVGLAEMNMLLLKKVEELTLYTLTQEKKIGSMEKILGKQNETIDKLESKNKQLRLLEERINSLEETMNKN